MRTKNTRHQTYTWTYQEYKQEHGVFFHVSIFSGTDDPFSLCLRSFLTFEENLDVECCCGWFLQKHPQNPIMPKLFYFLPGVNFGTLTSKTISNSIIYFLNSFLKSEVMVERKNSFGRQEEVVLKWGHRTVRL